jgi:hypothetical protein
MINKMDVFIEKIVVKQKESKDYFVIAGGILLGIFLILVFLYFIPTLIPFVGMGIIIGIYFLVKSRNIEFEYIVTNGEIDIDKITDRSRRKRVFTAESKSFEVVASTKSIHYTKDMKENSTILNYASSINKEDLYFIYLTYKGKKTVILFEPDEKMLKSIKSVIPRKVFI